LGNLVTRFSSRKHERSRGGSQLIPAEGISFNEVIEIFRASI
jgi:hypothetical protein